MIEAPSHDAVRETGAGRAFDPTYPMWAAVSIALFVAVAAVAYRPSTGSAAEFVVALLPWVTLAAITVVFLEEMIAVPRVVKATAVAVGLGGWTILVYQDSFWSVCGFAVYAMCFMAYGEFGVGAGIALAAVATVAWAGSYLTSDEANWLVVLPVIAFVSGSALTLQIVSTERRNAQQAHLIDRLHQTQQDLAVSERAKGVLEERARMAGEIHDTIAQGLTSIVILSRAGQRSESPGDALATIEETAQENLDAARRIVEALAPTELDATSLTTALRRHLVGALPTEVATEFHVIGEPRSLPVDIEVTVLRTAQATLANACSHAHAQRVDVTLSYFDDAIALDVSDDGQGFITGRVNDRGPLTGGQGIAALRHRAASLAGEVTIESELGRGTVVSLQLPTAQR